MPMNMKEFGNFSATIGHFCPNLIQNCEFRFFVQNAKFHDFVRFRTKRISCVPTYAKYCTDVKIK